jgi:hypothetical protein
MTMPKIISGGGITSNKYKTSKAGKQEPISHKVGPEAAAQLGRSEQFKKPNLEQGQGYQPYGPKDHTIAGPGAMRTIHKSGSQGLHGPVAHGERDKAPDPPATAPGMDILSDYGPERRNR